MCLCFVPCKHWCELNRCVSLIGYKLIYLFVSKVASRSTGVYSESKGCFSINKSMRSS